MNSSSFFPACEFTTITDKPEITKRQSKTQSIESYLADSSPNRTRLTAKWVVEDGKLVCHWIIDQNPPKQN